jgi:hypothetical protein
MEPTNFLMESARLQITGNVCTDWRLTHPIVTSFQDKDGHTQQVNSQAFKVFVKPDMLDGIAGSCQDAGYTWKQLDFQASVKPAAKTSPQAFL